MLFCSFRALQGREEIHTLRKIQQDGSPGLIALTLPLEQRVNMASSSQPSSSLDQLWWTSNGQVHSLLQGNQFGASDAAAKKLLDGHYEWILNGACHARRSWRARSGGACYDLFRLPCRRLELPAAQ
jgi:hypothetical protein